MKHAIPDDWDGSFCRFAICWPDSVLWRALLRGLISEPARGYFWDENTGSILGVLAQFRPTLDDNLDLPEVIMACNDTGVADALNAIALALSNQQNCPPVTVVSGGSGGVSCYSNATGGTSTIIQLPDGTPWPIFGDQPIAELPESGFPEGYPDQGTYDIDKCRKASKMADDFIATLRNMSVINWLFAAAGTAALGGALVGLITLPVAAIPVLLLLLLTQVGINAFIVELANQVEARKDELICLLYQGENVQNIYDGLHAFMTAIVIVIDPPAGIGLALVQMVLHLLNSDTLNNLFNSDMAEVYPDADCTCGEGYQWHFDEDAMGWEWEQVQGGEDVPGDWTDTLCSEGALFSQIQTAINPTNIQAWSIETIDVGHDVVGTNLVINVSSQSFPITLYRKVTYQDETFTELSEDIGIGGDHQMTLQSKAIMHIYIEVGFTSSNPSFDFVICINAVTVG